MLPSDSLAAGLGSSERCAEALELVDRQSRFDHREEHAFLEANVALEPLAELAERGGVGIRAALQFLPATTQVDMVCQHAHDRRVVDAYVPGERRQQQLFLNSEVARPLSLVEVEKGLACLNSSPPPGALELKRREQTLMVLVR